MPVVSCPRPAAVSDEQIIAAMLWAQENPAAWCEHVFNVHLEDYQREALNACVTHDRVLMQCGHGVGKSFTEACLDLWFLFCMPTPKVIVTGPSMRQVRDDVWASMHYLMRRFDYKRAHYYGSYKLNKTRLELTDDVFATGESSETGGTIEGYHAPYLLYDIDEAKEVSEDVYNSLDGALTQGVDTGGRSVIFMASTPGACSGRFWRAATGQERGWYIVRVNGEHSRRVSKQWIDYMRDRHGEESAEYKLRVRGEFDERAGTAVITMDLLQDLLHRRLDIPAGALPEIGIDVARKGANRTVFTVRVGPCVMAMMDRQRMDTVWVASKAAELADRLASDYGVPVRKIKIKVDDTGVGGGVTDTLRHRRYRVTGITASCKAQEEERFPSRRDELWFALRDRIHDHRLDISRVPRLLRDELVGELNAPNYSLRGERFVVEQKQETEKRLKKSPDLADSLILAFARPERTSFAGRIGIARWKQRTRGGRRGQAA